MTGPGREEPPRGLYQKQGLYGHRRWICALVPITRETCRYDIANRVRSAFGKRGYVILLQLFRLFTTIGAPIVKSFFNCTPLGSRKVVLRGRQFACPAPVDACKFVNADTFRVVYGPLANTFKYFGSIGSIIGAYSFWMFLSIALASRTFLFFVFSFIRSIFLAQFFAMYFAIGGKIGLPAWCCSLPARTYLFFVPLMIPLTTQFLIGPSFFRIFVWHGLTSHLVRWLTMSGMATRVSACVSGCRP